MEEPSILLYDIIMSSPQAEVCKKIFDLFKKESLNYVELSIKYCDTADDEIAYLKEEIERYRKYLKNPFTVKIHDSFHKEMLIN